MLVATQKSTNIINTAQQLRKEILEFTFLGSHTGSTIFYLYHQGKSLSLFKFQFPYEQSEDHDDPSFRVSDELTQSRA